MTIISIEIQILETTERSLNFLRSQPPKNCLRRYRFFNIKKKIEIKGKNSNFLTSNYFFYVN